MTTVNIQRIEDLVLVWLDSKINETNKGCRTVLSELRRVISNMVTFTETDTCIDFLEKAQKQHVSVIVESELGKLIMPRIHELSQVSTVFIYCGNKKKNEEWTKKWSKIQGVYTEIKPICESLKQTTRLNDKISMGFSLIETKTLDEHYEKRLDRLDPLFMYTQIIKEIILSIQFQKHDIDQYLEYCRQTFADDTYELKNIQEFTDKYEPKNAIWWYTCESFLYPMLNRALRLTDIDVIIKMGFFMADLHRHIEQLHKEQFNNNDSNNDSFTVYRGQVLNETDFKKLVQTKGGLIAFTNFLSTSKIQKVSVNFARCAMAQYPTSIGVLFVIKIDPSKSTTPFASIQKVSAFPEDEVLFSMHSVFRVQDIVDLNDTGRFFQVNLSLTNDDDEDLRQLTDRIYRENYPDQIGWYRLASVLRRMGHHEKSVEIFQKLLDSSKERNTESSIYIQQGLSKFEIGQYNEALELYQKALEIDTQNYPANHPMFISTYNNIGNVYRKLNEHSKALTFYTKAREIQTESYPPFHPDIASTCNNIGSVYTDLGKYYDALPFYQEALAIQLKSLPPNHPDVAVTCNNMGSIYLMIGEHLSALPLFEKANTIQLQSLPPDHPDLSMPYNSIGLIYYYMKEYSKALSSHEKALEIRKKCLASNHPDLATSYNNIGLVYFCMEEYSKALSSFEDALNIQKQSLPPNHPDFGSSYNNIGMVYDGMGEYSKAISNYEAGLEIKKQSLPPGHPNLTTSYNNIGVTCEKCGDFSKACTFFEQAVSIGQQSLPSNHPNLQIYLSNLQRVKSKL